MDRCKVNYSHVHLIRKSATVNNAQLANEFKNETVEIAPMTDAMIILKENAEADRIQ